MYNMINCGKSSAPFTISEYLNDIIGKDDEVRYNWVISIALSIGN